MDSNTIIIILSALIIVSYLFDTISRKIKLPSVLLLLILGFAIRQWVNFKNLPIYDFSKILPTVGTIGLILIVLEGALELHYQPEKKHTIKTAFSSATFGLLYSVLLITGILFFFTDASIHQCIATAVPFGVISSTMAIPSSQALAKGDREFVIYESSFSDILGVMFMNFIVYNEQLKLEGVIGFGFDFLSILLITILSSLFLLYVLGKIKHSVKFFLILALLLLIYALGKEIHLAPLFLILGFGLFLANAGEIKNKWFQHTFIYPELKHDLTQLYQVTSESAFLMRTLFFTLFGFMIQMETLADWSLYTIGGLILICVYLPRIFLLKTAFYKDLSPLLFMVPRGLISILLYLTLPEHLKIQSIGEGTLVFVVVCTSIIMSLGVMFQRKNSTN